MYSKTNVHTVKSTNDCVVIIKKYLYCKYVIMYSKRRNVSTKELYCNVLIYLRGNSIGMDDNDDGDNDDDDDDDENDEDNDNDDTL
jgi:hypothetical protein